MFYRFNPRTDRYKDPLDTYYCDNCGIVIFEPRVSQKDEVRKDRLDMHQDRCPDKDQT